MEKDGRILPLDDGNREALSKQITAWAATRLRTLCLAYRDVETADSPITPVTLGVEGIPVIRPTPRPEDAGTSASVPVPAGEEQQQLNLMVRLQLLMIQQTTNSNLQKHQIMI